MYVKKTYYVTVGICGLIDYCTDTKSSGMTGLLSLVERPRVCSTCTQITEAYHPILYVHSISEVMQSSNKLKTTSHSSHHGDLSNDVRYHACHFISVAGCVGYCLRNAGSGLDF